MGRRKKVLNNNVISVGDQVRPEHFKNLPTNNKLQIDPEVLMTALRSKTHWNDPDPYNLNSPEECARISHAWSNEYLILNNLL